MPDATPSTDAAAPDAAAPAAAASDAAAPAAGAAPAYAGDARAWAAGAALALVALGAVAWFGLRWDADTPVARLAVTGARHAHPDSLRALARLDTGLTMGAVEPLLVADRVRQHPWVADVQVARRPGGVVALAVTERTPAALALGPDGWPAAYLDAGGFALPLPDTLDADVPLVRPAARLQAGALPRTRPAVGPAVVAALRALRQHPAQALVAEVVAQADSTVRLVTRPAPGARGALAVRLGRDGPGADAYRAKLRRLEAFWQQVLAPRAAAAGPPVRAIDLRFHDHILTHP